MIRLSVTDLDGYLYWLGNETADLSELITRLRGQEEPTVQMRAGRAFHKVFEESKAGEIQTIAADGFTFDFAIDRDIAVPDVRELKGEIVLPTHVGPVTLVGKVDALNGATVIDYKLTERFEAERYADSYQWRAYLLMFSGTRFDYEVFQARYGDDNTIVIYDHHPLSFYAYPGMREDVLTLVSSLAEIVAKHVPEKIMSEAA